SPGVQGRREGLLGLVDHLRLSREDASEPLALSVRPVRVRTGALVRGVRRLCDGVRHRSEDLLREDREPALLQQAGQRGVGGEGRGGRAAADLRVPGEPAFGPVSGRESAHGRRHRRLLDAREPLPCRLRHRHAEVPEAGALRRRHPRAPVVQGVRGRRARAVRPLTVMAAANGVPVLWQFRASHFNEKARWALDWKGVRHQRRSLLPGPHAPVVMWLTGQKSVPVLQLDGKAIADSTRIVAALEERFPDRPLYPPDPAVRQRALELEDVFDEEIGPHLRRVLFHLILPDGRFTADLMSPGFGTMTKAAYAAFFPLTRMVMRMDMGITDNGAWRSQVRFDAALDRLEREI